MRDQCRADGCSDSDAPARYSLERAKRLDHERVRPIDADENRIVTITIAPSVWPSMWVLESELANTR